MREDIKEGDELMLIKSNEKIIMKKASELDENFKEDLEFAKRTEEAWEKYKKGEFKSMDSKDFLTEIEKW
tara:strand:+ start:2878 stop:3087 length:210 start_codon:yes stop_codon:yes gene_type:complete